MLALISQMLLCLLAAAVVGFLVAWFLRAGQVAELTSEAERLRAIVPTGVLPSALSTRLELLVRMMEEVKSGRPATEAAATELHRLLEAQQGLQGTVSELARRPPPTPPAVDLTPIVQRLETLSGDGAEALANRVEARLDDLAVALDDLRSRPSPAVDVGPSLATASDMAAVERRLHALAQELAALQLRLAAPPPPPPRRPRPPREERDDLILIHGVGPVLQRLLHRMGVYRFEQVMRWDANDIAAVTERLPNFKGRIEREGWVESARQQYDRKYGHRSSEAAAHSH